MPDGNGQGDLGSGTLRLADQDRAPMVGGGVANQHQAKAQSEAAVLNARLTQVAAEGAAQDLLGDSGATVQNVQGEQLFGLHGMDG